MIVRFLAGADLDAILAIQSSSPEAAHWSRGDYARACLERAGTSADEWLGWVAERAGKVVGFVVTRRVADEMEILNLAVEPDARRQGIGSVLLAEALAFGREGGAARVFLEVRESNHAAIAFYTHHAFSLSGRRRNYYSAPAEDALVLSLVLRESEPASAR